MVELLISFISVIFKNKHDPTLPRQIRQSGKQSNLWKCYTGEMPFDTPFDHLNSFRATVLLNGPTYTGSVPKIQQKYLLVIFLPHIVDDFFWKSSFIARINPTSYYHLVRPWHKRTENIFHQKIWYNQSKTKEGVLRRGGGFCIKNNITIFTALALWDDSIYNLQCLQRDSLPLLFSS